MGTDRKEYQKQWYQAHKEQKNEKKKQWRTNNAEKHKEYSRDYAKTYRKTKNGRARQLLNGYIEKDNIYNRGDCTLTSNWIVDRIFNSSCVYCGDSDWKHLGCDRIDNTKPHTPENCICACGVCNIERQIKKMSVGEFTEFRKTHPRGWDSIDNLKPDIVEINGEKVLKKKAG